MIILMNDGIEEVFIAIKIKYLLGYSLKGICCVYG